MSGLDALAWGLLCIQLKDNGLHQYDFWEDVPTDVKEKYREIARISPRR